MAPNRTFIRPSSESFYVMEGVVRLFNGETSIDAAKGDFRYVRSITANDELLAVLDH